MSVYVQGPAGVVGLWPGDVQRVFNAEQPVAGISGASTSQQVALAESEAGELTTIGVSGFFAGAPGAFEIDIQGSNVDNDNEYSLLQDPAAKIVAVDANNRFNATIKCNNKFVKAAVAIRTNAVALTLDIKR